MRMAGTTTCQEIHHHSQQDGIGRCCTGSCDLGSGVIPRDENQVILCGTVIHTGIMVNLSSPRMMRTRPYSSHQTDSRLGSILITSWTPENRRMAFPVLFRGQESDVPTATESVVPPDFVMPPHVQEVWAIKLMEAAPEDQQQQVIRQAGKLSSHLGEPTR